MNITPDEFADIINGTAARPWPDRGFCIARLLESVNWFDVVKIFSPAELCAAWDEARKHIKNPSIVKGMEFACRILR